MHINLKSIYNIQKNLKNCPLEKALTQTKELYILLFIFQGTFLYTDHLYHDVQTKLYTGLQSTSDRLQLGAAEGH